MAQTLETKTPDALEQKIVDAELETGRKCRKAKENVQN